MWSGKSVCMWRTAHIFVSRPGLRKHDVCFLLTVRAKMSLHEGFDATRPFVSQVGLVYVRGCEVEGMLDAAGKVSSEFTKKS